jgi:uncharacterized membrane protein YkvA (DUF1232 family)
MLDHLKQWARTVKQDTLALYLAARDPRTPWYAKALALFVVAYALSPIDLIPDFIPVIGYLDDLLIVPIGLWLAVSLIPTEVMEESRLRSTAIAARPVSKRAAGVIVAIWLAAAAILAWLVYKTLGGD